MRAHKKFRAFYALASLLLLTSAAEARRVNARFFLDGAAGVSIPIAQSPYADAFWPAPKLSLRLGAELWLTHRFGLAPELALDGAPLISRGDDDVHAGKGRFQVGLRLLAGFGRGHAFFGRFLLGAEVINQTAGFTTEPGLGMQFRIAHHAVAGFTLGFPLSVYHFTAPERSVVQVDFDLLVFIGLRI
ncbi:MAG TPA: hypothetical protein VFF06_13040 [Polyangia bacterium]|nr:hypothetical protein [Polyangia bacterium]